MPPFMPGLDLAEAFYQEGVKPVLDAHFPHLAYAAALLGSGSEVQGYDTALSMDHQWGPRLQIFVEENVFPELGDDLSAALSTQLPAQVRGFSTNFGPPDAGGVRLPQPAEHGPIQHMVETTTMDRFFKARLGVGSDEPITNRDWLLFPQQRLLEVTEGRVFHDDLGLQSVQLRFSWYPNDVWLYLLAAQWRRISQVEPFVGRTGDAGDDLGSAIIAAGLVRDLMRLVFLMERRYAPYAKWFGTAFSRLSAAAALGPMLRAVLRARSWQDREHHLSAAYSLAASMHNELGITKPLAVEVSSFHTRPYQVIHAERFTAAIRETIEDSYLRLLPDIGGVDQVTDNTDVLSYTPVFRKLAELYEVDTEE